jgi:anti-sigma-K factor RskA
MSAKNNNKNLLSSWKEIAAYLDMDERTCRRWEKKFDLPIHRLDKTPKSRVFAYREELDGWLQTRLSSATEKKKGKGKAAWWRKSLIIALPLIAVAAVAMYFLLLKSAEAPKREGVPQSSGRLTLEDNDIVTTEFSQTGRLRVWRKDSSDSFSEVWRIEPVSHACVAVGNVDDKRDCEIVAPGICQDVKDKSGRRTSSFRIFINVYKQGKKDWWKTTYYSPPECLYVENNPEISEIAIGDVDGISGNEVVLMTVNGLGILKYDEELEEFKLMKARYSFLEDTHLAMKSLVVKNIDDDESDEILIAAERWSEDGLEPNIGYILVLKVRDGWPQLTKSIEIDANFQYQSLRAGDVIPGGYPEILASGYRKHNDLWNSYIIGLNSQGDKVFDMPVFLQGDYRYRAIHLAVGNIAPHQGWEVVIGDHSIEGLKCFFWDGSKLVESSKYPIAEYFAPTNVFISGDSQKKDSMSDVIVSGFTNDSQYAGQFYLGIFNFDQGFFPIWERMGGAKGDMRVSYAAVAKKHE